MLEIEVALVLLGLALTGLFPLVTIHCRGLAALGTRVIPTSTAYLMPAADPWARNSRTAPRSSWACTAPASSSPAAGAAPPPAAVNSVQIISFQHALGSQQVSARSRSTRCRHDGLPFCIHAPARRVPPGFTLVEVMVASSLIGRVGGHSFGLLGVAGAALGRHDWPRAIDRRDRPCHNRPGRRPGRLSGRGRRPTGRTSAAAASSVGCSPCPANCGSVSTAARSPTARPIGASPIRSSFIAWRASNWSVTTKPPIPATPSPATWRFKGRGRRQPANPADLPVPWHYPHLHPDCASAMKTPRPGGTSVS